MDLRVDGADDDAESLPVDTMRRYADTYDADHPETVAAAEGAPTRFQLRFAADLIGYRNNWRSSVSG